MFLVCIFPYPVGLFFLRLMIFRLRWLLVLTGAMCEGFNVFFLYFPRRHPAWEFPFQSRRPSSSTGGPRRIETLPQDSLSASMAQCSAPPPRFDGWATGSPPHWKLRHTS